MGSFCTFLSLRVLSLMPKDVKWNWFHKIAFL
jgi:hypothetical protein